MAGRCNSCGNPTIDELIEAILARMICEREGLDVDEARQCLRVILSPGGNLEFDQFGRLRSTCCDDSGDPQPAACVRTVADLPEFIVSGQGGGGALIHPYGSPQGIDYAIDHGLDMVSNGTWATTDDVATWAIYEPDVLLHGYTDTPSSTEIGAGASSSDWVGLLVDAGTRDSPTSEGAYAPEDFKVPYGGWYGFYAPQYYPQTLANVLRGLSKRIVTWADIANSGDADLDQRSVVAALAGVAAACNADSTILSVHSDMAEYVETIANAQVTPALVVTSTDVTPQQVLDSGAEWVRLSGNWTTGQIQPYVDAGLQVMLFTNSRHHVTQKALDVGARGITAWDPVYARGAVDPMYQYYRRPNVRYVLRRTELGMLTQLTDGLSLISGRPFMKSGEYGMFVWVTDARVRNATLIGAACPLPSPEEDSYTWQVQLDQNSLPQGDGPKIGVIYGGETDLDATDLEGGHVGYACYIRVGTQETGLLEIGRYDADGTYEVLAVSSTSRVVTPNGWMDFRLEVTPSALTLTRTDGGTPYSVTATDSMYRGPYVHWMCNSTDPDGRFGAGVREFTVASTAAAGGAEAATTLEPREAA